MLHSMLLTEPGTRRVLEMFYVFGVGNDLLLSAVWRHSMLLTEPGTGF